MISPEYRSCPGCGRADPAVVLTTRDHVSLETFTVVRCTGCTLYYLGDAPPLDELGRYYANEMGAGMHNEPGWLFRNLRRIRIDRDLAPLLAPLDSQDLVLDFGTGDGSVAARVAQRGYRVAAVDMFDPAEWTRPTIPYRAYAPGTGLAPDEFVFDGRPTRAMVLRHVLEHVLDPVHLLRQAHEAGVARVMVTVPNVESRLRRPLGAAWSHWDPPRHVTYFSSATLTAVSASAGYRVERLSTYGIDELVSSLNRVLSVRHAEAPAGVRASLLGAVLPLLQAKGPLSALSAASASVLGNCVCHAILVPA